MSENTNENDLTKLSKNLNLVKKIFFKLLLKIISQDQSNMMPPQVSSLSSSANLNMLPTSQQLQPPSSTQFMPSFAGTTGVDASFNNSNLNLSSSIDANKK